MEELRSTSAVFTVGIDEEAELGSGVENKIRSSA